MQTTPAQQGTFTHTPRPAIVAKTAGHTNQRRFGVADRARGYVISPTEQQARAMNTELQVFRDAEFDMAEVTIDIGLYTCASITVRLNPAELRDLATRLIDAAHDIESLPAAVLARDQHGGAACATRLSPAQRNALYAVWHLIGPQACGKTRYAEATIAALRKLGCVGARMESHEFQRLYSSNPERVADDNPGLKVLMIEDNTTRPGDTPPHFMQGDRIIDLTDYLPIRRPGIEGIQAKIRLNQPNWPEDTVQAQAKHQYERGFGREAAPC